MFKEQVTMPTLQCYEIHTTEKAAGMGIPRRKKCQRVNQEMCDFHKDDGITFVSVNEALTSTAQQANKRAT